jgi:hypothetical protein
MKIQKKRKFCLFQKLPESLFLQVGNRKGTEVVEEEHEGFFGGTCSIFP